MIQTNANCSMQSFGFFRLLIDQVFKIKRFSNENGMLALVQDMPFSSAY